MNRSNCLLGDPGSTEHQSAARNAGRPCEDYSAKEKERLTKKKAFEAFFITMTVEVVFRSYCYNTVSHCHRPVTSRRDVTVFVYAYQLCSGVSQSSAAVCFIQPFVRPLRGFA